MRGTLNFVEIVFPVKLVLALNLRWSHNDFVVEKSLCLILQPTKKKNGSFTSDGGGLAYNMKHLCSAVLVRLPCLSTCNVISIGHDNSFW